jgi:hypothetical protein
VHPEGNPFFYNKELRLVTDNNVRDAAILSLLEAACANVHRQRQDDATKLPYADLYLRLQHGNVADYYFVDHINRNLFWLHDISSLDLDLPEAVSPLHLGHVLEDEYWVHVEYFPCSVFNLTHTTQTLLAVLSAGRIGVS